MPKNYWLRRAVIDGEMSIPFPMAEHVITGPGQVSTDWLTTVLTQGGALTSGAVSSFELVARKSSYSTNASLLIRYTSDARGLCPPRLFLKMVDTRLGNDDDFDESEVNYYTRDYVNLDNAPLVRCFDAGYSQRAGRYHVLLEDVSETHVAAGDQAPTLEYGLALAEALAVLHARRWSADSPAQASASMHSTDHIQNFADVSRHGIEQVLGRFSSELQPHWQGLLYELYAKHPQALIERTQNPNGFTLVHGDVGCRNILVPRYGSRPIYIIDRQPFKWALTTWLGVYDIVYAIVLDWDTVARRQSENLILARYHEHLVRNGVRDYSYQELLDDYRLCVPMAVYVAAECFRHESGNERWVYLWLQMLQRALTACDDLACSHLW